MINRILVLLSCAFLLTLPAWRPCGKRNDGSCGSCATSCSSCGDKSCRKACKANNHRKKRSSGVMPDDVDMDYEK